MHDNARTLQCNINSEYAASTTIIYKETLIIMIVVL